MVRGGWVCGQHRPYAAHCEAAAERDSFRQVDGSLPVEALDAVHDDAVAACKTDSTLLAGMKTSRRRR